MSDSLSFIHSALDDAGLTPQQFRVYANIARRAGTDGYCDAGIENMAEVCRIHADTVRTCLKVLYARQMVGFQDRLGRTRIHRLLPTSQWVHPPESNGGVESKGLPSLPGGIQGRGESNTPPFVSGETPPKARDTKVLPEGTPPEPPLQSPPDAAPPVAAGKKVEEGGGLGAEELARRRALGQRVALLMYPTGRHAWDDNEKKAVRKLYPVPQFEESISVVELYYALPDDAFPLDHRSNRREDYRRRDLLRLLRHWWGEVKAAERFFEKHPGWRRKMQAKLYPGELPPPRPAPPAPEIEFAPVELPPIAPPSPEDFAMWRSKLDPPEPEVTWDGMDQARRSQCLMWIFRKTGGKTLTA